MKISYGKQYIDKSDKKAVVEALSSNLITQGSYVENFERNLKQKFGSKYACAVSSGTAGMHLVGKALNWGKNDLILMSAVTFVSTANIIEHLGAKLDLVDIDKFTYNIDLEKLEKKIIYYKRKKIKIKAVIPTDYAGLPCDWKNLSRLSKKYKFQIINDNCHAVGAKYLENISYATNFADASVHSYHPVKSFTTGEGGAIFTNKKKIYDKIKILRSHGIEKRNKNNISWYYDVKNIGFNYRINDFQCALGISQLKKLNKFLNKRKEIAKYYFKKFKNIKNIKLPQNVFNKNHSYHLFSLLIDFKKIYISKKNFFLKLKKENIFLQVHYIPIYRLSYFKKKYNFSPKDYTNSERFYEQAVSLPIFYSLKKIQLDKIIKIVKKIINRN